MAFAHKTKHQCHLCAYSSSVKAELRKHIVANHENGVTCTIDGCNITIAYNRSFVSFCRHFPISSFFRLVEQTSLVGLILDISLNPEGQICRGVCLGPFKFALNGILK